MSFENKLIADKYKQLILSDKLTHLTKVHTLIKELDKDSVETLANVYLQTTGAYNNKVASKLAQYYIGSRKIRLRHKDVHLLNNLKEQLYFINNTNDWNTYVTTRHTSNDYLDYIIFKIALLKLRKLKKYSTKLYKHIQQTLSTNPWGDIADYTVEEKILIDKYYSIMDNNSLNSYSDRTHFTLRINNYRIIATYDTIQLVGNSVSIFDDIEGDTRTTSKYLNKMIGTTWKELYNDSHDLYSTTIAYNALKLIRNK